MKTPDCFVIVTSLLLCLGTLHGRADNILWNESVDGSLKLNSEAIPVDVGVAQLGENLVEGFTTYHPTGNSNAVVSLDFFSFTVPQGDEADFVGISTTFNYQNSTFGYQGDFVTVSLMDGNGNNLIFPETFHNQESNEVYSDLPAGIYSIDLYGGYAEPNYEPQPTQDVITNYIINIDIMQAPEPPEWTEVMVGLFAVVGLRFFLCPNSRSF